MTKQRLTPPMTSTARRRALLQTKRRSVLSPNQSNRSLSRPWIGFRGKTLWDWFQVILIPVVLGIYTLVTTVNMAEQQNIISEQQTTAMQQQNRIADEQLKSEILQNYTDKIEDLILHEELLKSGSNVRTIATTQTHRALRQLDGERKGNLLLSIYQLKLIDRANPIIDLFEANLSRANLDRANLMEANLSQADLSHANLNRAFLFKGDLSLANLSGTDLYGSNLSEADLSGTNLSGARLHRANLSEANLLRETNLSGADLSGALLFGIDLSKANLDGANLYGANVTDEQLKQAMSLHGATMPDGSKHP